MTSNLSELLAQFQRLRGPGDDPDHSQRHHLNVVFRGSLGTKGILSSLGPKKATAPGGVAGGVEKLVLAR